MASGFQGNIARPYTAVMVVPTGVGAAIGGYAGDALPAARVVASVVDRLITHPNVMNGAQLYWPLPNALYVEGFGLDHFAARQWGLRPVHRNRIGLVLDAAIEEELRGRHIQAAEATRATLGLDLLDYVITDAPLGVTLRQADSGATWGTLERPDSLLRAAEKALAEGADAIAVVARFPDDEDEADLETLHNYRLGQGVDLVAGAEAVISHLVVRTFGVPCAHAQALSPLPLDSAVSPKAAAEEIGYTFLPCVLAGLSRAPRFVTQPQAQSGYSQPENLPPGNAGDIWADQVDAILVPASACGGGAVLSLSRTKTLVIAVADNTTAINVPLTALGRQPITVASYLEAVGVIAAHRAGVHPQALTAQVPHLSPLAD